MAHFFDFLRHLKPSCVLLTIFFDFGSIFGGSGRVVGRILGGFFDEFWYGCSVIFSSHFRCDFVSILEALRGSPTLIFAILSMRNQGF